MGLAELLDQRKDLLRVLLVFKLLQIVEELVQNLREEGTLADRGLPKEQVDLLP